ncbi:MAG: hypothetical protein ABJL99_00675 [Aliishimia sp.]
MTLRRSLATFTLMTMATFGAHMAAADVLYDCDIRTSERHRGWVSPKMAIVERDTGAVQVVDAILISTDQSPITARVTRNTDKILMARWVIKKAEGRDTKVVPNLDYDFRLNKQNGRISVGLGLVSGGPRIAARGSCKTQTE